jgi:hypothetical protein
MKQQRKNLVNWRLNNMKFKKEFMQRLVYGDEREYKSFIVEDKIVDTSRWSIIHSIIFYHDGKYYESSYSVGATENQDERPYEYDDDEIECPEMVRVKKVVEVWERKN